MAFSQGLVSGTDIPVEHLDYQYIGKCENATEVEALLKVLRSGKEGHYPDLVKFTEERLQKLDPESKLLIKRKEAQKLRDLPSTDSQAIAQELEQWEQEMNSEDTHLQDVPSNTPGSLANGELPPIRKAGPITMGATSEQREAAGNTGSGGGNKERLASGDYRGWDRYDVKKECGKVDTEPAVSEEKTPGHTHTVQVSLSETEQKMSAPDKKRLALREKEKGNEAFRAGDYEEALTYYSRSILLDHIAPSINNRAITHIKLQRFQEALLDCSAVLKLEPTNTKALLRQGTAFLGVKDWKSAETVMRQLLKLEPKNKKAQEVLDKALDEIAKSATSGAKKGRRVQIEEVDEEPVQSSPPPAEPEPVTSTTEVSNEAPMPQDVAEWKEKGNELFRKGQYGEAVSCYSRAVQRLEAAGEGHTTSLSVLLNNRAACQLKNGNSQACIADCTQSLQLSPVNIKALVRRAQAYEHMERYRQAYVDNQLALSLDRSMESVYSTNNRLSKHLMDQDGPNWREKLPPHPDQSRVMQALNQRKSHPDVNSAVSAPVTSTATPTSSTEVPPTAEAPPTAEPSATPTASLATPTTSATPSVHSVTTSSSTTGFQTKVTQATTPISTSTTAAPPLATPPAEPSDAERFERAKAKGNEHVKKGRYVEGLNCYSTCIAACPDRVVGYTNRALCHLKLSSPTSAEKDCSKALELESDNIKALYRRALARKAMTKYAESMKDLKQLLELDAENSVAKGEYATVKHLWEKQLRQLQDKNQKQKGKNNKKKASPGHKQKVGTRGEKSLQQQELEQLLAETKNKMKELEKDSSLNFTRNPSDYLNASKTTYYKSAGSKTATPGGASSGAGTTKGAGTTATTSRATTGGTRRRKVVVEEESSEQSQATGQQRKPGRTSPATAQGRREGASQSQRNRAESSKASQQREKLSQSQGKDRKDLQQQVKKKEVSMKKEEESRSEREAGTTQQEVRMEASSQQQGSKGGSAPGQGEVLIPAASQGKVEETGGEEPSTGEGKGERREDPPQSKSEEQRAVTDVPSSPDAHVRSAQLPSPFEFVRRWNNISRGGSTKEYAALLEEIPPSKLPEIITNKLEGAMLTKIILAISKEFLPQERYQHSLEILENMSKVPRFQTIAMFLGKQDKTELSRALDVLEQQDVSLKPTTSSLRKLYGVNT